MRRIRTGSRARLYALSLNRPSTFTSLKMYSSCLSALKCQYEGSEYWVHRIHIRRHETFSMSPWHEIVDSNPSFMIAGLDWQIGNPKVRRCHPVAGASTLRSRTSKSRTSCQRQTRSFHYLHIDAYPGVKLYPDSPMCEVQVLIRTLAFGPSRVRETMSAEPPLQSTPSNFATLIKSLLTVLGLR